MSGQSGGTGYNKIKKSCQSGGASGWAKHCGDTKDHKLSNRTERRLAKEQLTEDDGVARVPPKSKRKKIPTRKHLLDRLSHWSGQQAQRQRDIKQHKKERGNDCPCQMYCSDRWIDKYYAENIAKVLKEFDKHGYARP